MAYNENLAVQLRQYLLNFTGLKVEEKKMFGGLAFMVNGKMCINVSGERLMCRFDPALTEEIAKRAGYLPMVMKGKALQGYCYVMPEGFSNTNDFAFWVDLCLAFNKQ